MAMAADASGKHPRRRVRRPPGRRRPRVPISDVPPLVVWLVGVLAVLAVMMLLLTRVR